MRRHIGDAHDSSSSYLVAQLGAPMPRHVVGSTAPPPKIGFPLACGVRAVYLADDRTPQVSQNNKAFVRIPLSASTPALFLLPARRGWRQGSPSIDPYPSRAAVDRRQGNHDWPAI
jgi:hypothetical protein